MSEPQRFRAELRAARGGGAAFIVPAEAGAALGPVKRPPVPVTVHGHEFRTRLAVYGGEQLVGVSKANRAAAGIDVGDTFEATVAVEAGPRTVEVPDDLAAALADQPDLVAALDRLSFGHRREYVLWITEAKRADTRARRVAGTLEGLREGRTRR